MSILQTLYVFLPALTANAAPVLLSNVTLVRRYNRPLWTAAFGSHKTWIGFIGGTIVGAATALLQFFVHGAPLLADFTAPYASVASSVAWGALLGVGALTGDTVKSYFKRRLRIPPGGALPVIDGMDHMIGALLFTWPLYAPPVWHVVVLLALSPLLSLAANSFSYLVGWKDRWY